MREESKCERRLEFRKRGYLAVEAEKLQILKTYFGYDSFRPGQEEIIDQILAGRDALAIMPTGAGKSLCYQVPALMLSGITIVISPLISLMMDQVKALNEAGIHAAYINSSLTENQVAKALEFAKAGRYKIVYVAPERLETPRFLDFACHAEISMVTVDEAHCISQWGQDFRPSYVRIVSFIRQLPVRPIVTAFTATATKRVQTDIRKVLKLQNPYVAVTGFDRENLYFEVQRTKEKKKESGSIWKNIRMKAELFTVPQERMWMNFTCFWKVRDFPWADIMREWAMKQERAVRRILFTIGSR